MSGWGSWLSGADTSATDSQPNFKAISDTPQNALFAPLEKSDLEWTCAGGFTTETQVWYTILDDGAFATSQIIHSAIGLWYPQIQVTFKYFNPKTGQKIWKSASVSKFETPAPQGTGRDKSKQHDKRSCKGEQFSVIHNGTADGTESYTIEANMDAEVQLSYTFTKSAKHAGWKLGAGPEGGKSFFGSNAANPDGYVIHRFWPRTSTTGHILIKGQAIDAKGQGMFIHAIQGMRPNLVASRWNFANFQSEDLAGVAAISMEFTTTSDYGGPVGSGTPKSGSQISQQGGQPNRTRETRTVTIGSISVGDELVAVTAGTRHGKTAAPGNSDTQVEHQKVKHDAETGYTIPEQLHFVWDGPLLVAGKPQSEKVRADLTADISAGKGLIERVDVLGEMPAMVRKVVNYVAGTKPYIWQSFLPAKLNLTLPESYKSDSASAGAHTVDGTWFGEFTFISEP
ncbi:SVF1-LIKE PROTEIN YDR222W-RELATED [Ceraceosorus bombacis]|uniref:SVF1-LIKE PROTEIN YDR222W-RELATED n=1 Tax=Ceraceosorus bombacis TaxID=401625 RepID=A0A0N7LBB1_9BASI|nr:SVF1-LIKE PROTEIN YDR222W-RELATED [Ceraceosorus bombacis]